MPIACDNVGMRAKAICAMCIGGRLPPSADVSMSERGHLDVREGHADSCQLDADVVGAAVLNQQDLLIAHLDQLLHGLVLHDLHSTFAFTSLRSCRAVMHICPMKRVCMSMYSRKLCTVLLYEQHIRIWLE